jgi:DNA-directed RNA polymerase specialized sigma24 family protein
MTLDQAFMKTHFNRLAKVAARLTGRLPIVAREEIFSASILWMLEHPYSFDPERGEGALEGRLVAWFAGIVKNERRRFLRQELPAGRADALEKLAADSDTAAEVEVPDIVASLPPKAQEAVAAFMLGDSLRTVAAATGMNRGELRALKKRLRFQLRTAPVTLQHGCRRTPPTDSEAEHEHSSRIDRDLARIDNTTPPRHGAECAPCLLCLWFEGFKGAKDPGTAANVEMRSAIAGTYYRKVEISAWLGDGSPAPESMRIPPIVIADESLNAASAA